MWKRKCERGGKERKWDVDKHLLQWIISPEIAVILYKQEQGGKMCEGTCPVSMREKDVLIVHGG